MSAQSAAASLGAAHFCSRWADEVPLFTEILDVVACHFPLGTDIFDVTIERPAVIGDLNRPVLSLEGTEQVRVEGGRRLGFPGRQQRWPRLRAIVVTVAFSLLPFAAAYISLEQIARISALNK